MPSSLLSRQSVGRTKSHVWVTKMGFNHVVEAPVGLKDHQMSKKRVQKQARRRNAEKARAQRAQNIQKSTQGATLSEPTVF